MNPSQQQSPRPTQSSRSSTTQAPTTATPPPLGDAMKYSFEVVVETSKQIITLSTGLIALGILFAKDFAVDAPTGARVLLAVSWLFLLLSMVTALFGTLGTVTGNLAKSSGDEPASPYAGNITLFSQVQAVLFLLGLAASVVAGICMM